MHLPYPPLSAGHIDRDGETRENEERLAEAWRAPNTRVLLLRGREIPLREHASQTALVYARAVGTWSVTQTSNPAPIFLGRLNGAAVFVLDLPAERSAAELPNTVELPSESRKSDQMSAAASIRWRSFLEAGTQLSDAERELVAIGFAIVNWQRSAQYSPLDGSLTQPRHGGWMRLDGAGVEHFPRTDPAVIVLIEHDDRVLLGSNVLWDQGRFSLLAGFVEAGESFEQAVMREVYEEAGVRLTNIRYLASQSWPFPRSLMAGFMASLAPGSDPQQLIPQAEEIAELRWFTRDELRVPPPGISLPHSFSIAGWMLQSWVEGAPAARSPQYPRDVDPTADDAV